MWEFRQSQVQKALFGLVLLVCGMFGVAPDPLKAGRFEAGSFSAHDTNGNPNPVRVNFQQAFDTVPIVVALIGNSGSDSAKIRITNVSTTGFDELIIEPDNFDGPHIAETIHYIAVEPGRHVLPGGGIVEAGTTSVSAVQHGAGVSGSESWATINYSAALPGTPAVLTHIQTANSETRTVASQTSRPFITTTTRNLSPSSFQVALERSETSAGPIPSAETVGWIAFPAGTSGTFPDISSNVITWSGVNSATNIRGWGNGCFTNGFGQTSASAIVIAKKNTHNGGDGGWIRRCSLSSTTVGLTVDEDTSRDTERNHTSEAASIIAFSQAFHADLQPGISITKASVSFTDALGGGFALPDAMVEYLITVQNAGNAPPNHDSVIVTEALPAELDLIVSDFTGPGSGPFQYLDGSPSTGLNCVFTSFISTTDCYSFSTDGSNFNHVPTDSGDGTDPAVTHIRITPSGYMEGNTGSGPSTFTLRFKGQID